MEFTTGISPANDGNRCVCLYGCIFMYIANISPTDLFITEKGWDTNQQLGSGMSLRPAKPYMDRLSAIHSNQLRKPVNHDCLTVWSHLGKLRSFILGPSIFGSTSRQPKARRQRSGQHQGCEALEALRGSVEHKELR